MGTNERVGLAVPAGPVARAAGVPLGLAAAALGAALGAMVAGGVPLGLGAMVAAGVPLAAVTTNTASAVQTPATEAVTVVLPTSPVSTCRLSTKEPLASL